MTLNENGKGQGTHSRVCKSDVITKCKCGQEFKGQFTGVYASVRLHLENNCSEILSSNARHLMNFSIEKFPGIPQWLIDARKKEGPFYYDELENMQHFLISDKIIKTGESAYYYGEMKFGTNIGKSICYEYDDNKHSLHEGMLDFTYRTIGTF